MTTFLFKKNNLFALLGALFLTIAGQAPLYATDFCGHTAQCTEHNDNSDSYTSAIRPDANDTTQWPPLDDDTLFVSGIFGYPTEITADQVGSLIVTFSEEIIASSFTTDDLTLVFDGGNNLIDNSVTIAQIDPFTYKIGLAGLTTGNGTYVFTVEAAGVLDLDSIPGIGTQQATWSQFLTVPVVQQFIGLPSFASSYDTVRLQFNLPLDPATVTANRFSILKGSIVQPGSLTLTPLNPQNTLYKLSGLGAVLSTDGEYELLVDLPNLQTANGVPGQETQSATLTLDTQAPQLTNLLQYLGSGLHAQHYTGVDINFSEEVQQIDAIPLSLWQNGQPIDILTVPITKVNGNTYQIGSFDQRTYPNGDYIFRLDMGKVADRAGNYGSGIQETSWTVNLVSSLAISNLAITPDMGHSPTDGITATTELTVSFDINEAANVSIYQNNNGVTTLLKALGFQAAGTLSEPLIFGSGGPTELLIAAVDNQSREVDTSMLLFLDETALSAAWDFGQNQQLNVQPASIDLTFSDRLLTTAALQDALLLKYNNTPQSTAGLTLTALTDTTYRLSGLENIGDMPGFYEVGVDLSLLQKYSSGMSAAAAVYAAWEFVQADVVRLDLKAMLEGAYSGNGVMHTLLNSGGELPNAQPYNIAPWNYEGAESVASMPADVVDWVLVSIRLNESKASTVGSVAALLRSDGQLLSVDGSTVLQVPVDSLGQAFHLVIYHRNHVGLMSAVPVVQVNGVYGVDFSASASASFGNSTGVKDLGDGRFGLFSGDSNGNGQVQNSDLFIFFQQIGIGGYWPSDFDMNSEVQNSDLQGHLNVNIGRGAGFEY